MSYPGNPVIRSDRETASSERESFPRGCGGRAEHPAYDRSHGVCGTSVGLLIIQWTGPVPVPPRLQIRDVTPLHHHNMKSDSQSLEVGHIWYEDLTASSAHIALSRCNMREWSSARRKPTCRKMSLKFLRFRPCKVFYHKYGPQCNSIQKRKRPCIFPHMTCHERRVE